MRGGRARKIPAAGAGVSARTSAREWLGQTRRAGGNPPADACAKGHRGIDGIYHRAGERPPWLVVEAKYGKGDLSRKKTLTGYQVENSWVQARLKKAINENQELYNKIDAEGYQRRLIHIDYDGSIEMKSLDYLD